MGAERANGFHIAAVVPGSLERGFQHKNLLAEAWMIHDSPESPHSDAAFADVLVAVEVGA